jgi:pyruvate/2-oxoglutarate dehydrogenase complex dihydrolipoamide acyltransferase (E2) component
MALQFFAVHSEALAYTHDALQAHAAAHGLRCPGPTRALRIAQLYGHLQLRAAGRTVFSLALCELATSWRLQPRQLRQDLALLQALGWLSATGTSRGTVITLLELGVAQPQASEPLEVPEPTELPAQGLLEPTDPQGHSGRSAPALPACSADQAPPASLTSPKAGRTATPAEPSQSSRRPSSELALLKHLTDLYNLHKPPTWPSYHPRGHGLKCKVRQALKQAGNPDALAASLIAALQAMPPFWRTTYPVGRSGAECFAALFSTDRGSAGLGVEFWHLFTWAQAAASPPAGTAEPSTTPGVAPTPELPLQRAQRLFLWDSGIWRGQGREALLLSPTEKRELALLLEAHGQGIPGTAERQFADPEAETVPQPQPPSAPQPQPQPQPPSASEACTSLAPPHQRPQSQPLRLSPRNRRRPLSRHRPAHRPTSPQSQVRAG